MNSVNSLCSKIIICRFRVDNDETSSKEGYVGYLSKGSQNSERYVRQHKGDLQKVQYRSSPRVLDRRCQQFCRARAAGADENCRDKA